MVNVRLPALPPKVKLAELTKPVLVDVPENTTLAGSSLTSETVKLTGPSDPFSATCCGAIVEMTGGTEGSGRIVRVNVWGALVSEPALATPPLSWARTETVVEPG